ncbi:hypothetical protein KCP73_12950 [Salmonella enterica subsp. enterica]|nr:hypothetical protein KCP73_12950 [Salmonella enterica subsp. enterica]
MKIYICLRERAPSARDCGKVGYRVKRCGAPLEKVCRFVWRGRHSVSPGGWSLPEPGRNAPGAGAESEAKFTGYHL